MENIQYSVLVIILNYKNYSMTLKLVEQLKSISYENMDILVVDNCSPNESAKVLRSKAKEQDFSFIANSKNAGYAAGNNIGIRYAIENNYRYAWVLNNDVQLTDNQILLKMVAVLQSREEISCVGPKIIDTDGNCCYPYVYRPSLWTMTLGIYNEKRKRAYHQNISGCVYRVHGCSMLLRSKDMETIGGLDEKTFLFEEENILAERLMKIHKRIYYCADTNLIHLESATIGRQRGLKCINKIKIINHSMEVYLRDYRHYNRFQRILCKLVRDALLFIRG